MRHRPRCLVFCVSEPLRVPCRNRAMALMLEAKDAAFHHMLKCMDDTSFNFEEKWALIMRQTGKPEFR